jgi:hypothetical protein
MTFEAFYEKLISDQLWFELLRDYKNETIKAAARKVYAQVVADSCVDTRPMSENRKHVYNILCKNPGDKPTKKWYDISKEEKKEDWVPASKAYADKCAAQALEIIRNSKTINAVPRVTHKQAIEEGDWLPKKEAPYPTTSAQEYYIRQRHFEYIKANYEPRTGQKVLDWVDEDTWNAIYDDAHLKKSGL